MERTSVIRKTAAELQTRSNFVDDEATRRGFNWVISCC